jgi:hypothetical protein
MSRKTSTKARALANQQLPCDVSGCRRRRHWTTLICHEHGIRRKRYGHVKGRAILKREFAPYLTDVRALLKKNPNHEGVTAADAMMARLITPGPERRPKRNGPGAAEHHLQVELTRIKRASVTPRAALETTIAVWLFAKEQPAVLPDDVRLTFAIAGAIFKLAPYKHYSYYNNHDTRKTHINSKPPGAGAQRLLGERIRTQLGLFVANVETTLRTAKHQRNRALAAMSEPFSSALSVPEEPAVNTRPSRQTRLQPSPAAPAQPVRVPVRDPSPIPMTRRLIFRKGQAVVTKHN